MATEKKKRVDKNRRQLEKGERYDQKYDRYVFQKQVNGRRISITAKTLQELRKEKNEMLAEIGKGFIRDGEKTRMSLDQYFDRWIGLYAESGRKATSVQNYRSYYETYCRGKLGKKLLKDITKADAQRLINDMVKSGKKHSTLSNLKSCLNILYESAADERIVVYNPIKNISLPKTDCKVRTAVNEDDLMLLMKFIKTDDRYKSAYPVIFCLFNLGCRIGELAALTWHDVDFENNTIRINKSLNRYRKKDYGFTLGIGSCKSKSSNRTVKMKTDVRKVLLELKLRGEYPTFVLPSVDDVGIVRGEVQDFIFANSFGNAWNEPSFVELLNRIIESYNKMAMKEKKKTIERFTPHQARHTFISALYNGGMEIESISEYVGHENTSTTQNVYAHISDKRKQEQQELFDSIKIG